MSITVKAYLTTAGRANDAIRRFKIPTDVSSSYSELCKKLEELLPALRDGNYCLYWTDPDGDKILFSTDEEQLEALDYMEDGIFKVHVKVKESVPTPAYDDELHICAGCKGPISGPQFRCLICPEFYLCESCQTRHLDVQHNDRHVMDPNFCWERL